jgi:hypothetical protein
MAKKKPALSINLRDDNAKRGEIRKVINLMSELKRSSNVVTKPLMCGLPTNPVYQKFYDDPSHGANKAVIEFELLKPEELRIVSEYIETNGGQVVDTKEITHSEKTATTLAVLIDTSNIR